MVDSGSRIPIRSLSFHARYRCRHSGACCSSGWPIPVEADRLERLRAALATGALRPEARAAPFAYPPDAPDHAPALLGLEGDRCVFFDASGRRCAVHRALGHDALPLACRQFPRVVLRDPRGVSIVLSHYCPTAAALLEAPGAEVAIVESAEAFPPSGEYVGLDARTALPPLLTPDVLMDWESWWETERLAVELLANSVGNAATALGRLRAGVERLTAWRPADGPLLEHVRGAFADARQPDAAPLDVQQRVPEVLAVLAPGLDPPTASGTDVAEPVLKRFLAAHAFASWTVQLGQGLEAWLRALEAAFAFVAAGWNVRQTDLILRHLSDPHTLARVWSAGAKDHGRAGRFG